MFFGRLPMIVLTLLFGLVVFAFARDLTGTAGGLLALALYTFMPDVIANGALATLDVPAAGFLLTAVWLLWRARTRPRLYLPLAGLATGGRGRHEDERARRRAGAARAGRPGRPAVARAGRVPGRGRAYRASAWCG